MALRLHSQGQMAIIQVLLAAVARSAGRILNTAVGWATMLIFGRVPEKRQMYVSTMTFGSLVWITVIVGIAFPSAGTFLLMEAAKDQVRQHVPDRRARHDRTGVRGIDDGVLGRHDLDGRERAGIVRELGGHDAFDPEPCVGVGLTSDDVSSSTMRTGPGRKSPGDSSLRAWTGTSAKAPRSESKMARVRPAAGLFDGGTSPARSGRARRFARDRLQLMASRLNLGMVRP